ncbi:DUF4199 domain-containing protein [Gaetbulibacter aestuarii]|uniref:DUF4199 domain-containing protein n=1 Tax=Gaetbulibacter aestuarii TaxID=1502358 RepID=A0ABW7MXE1_9FLAO
MENSLKKIPTTYGLFLGVVLSVVAIFAYTQNLDLFLKPWFGLSLYALCVIAGVLSLMKNKIANNSYLSFRNSFTSYFITVLAGVAIFTFVTYILFNYVDNDASNYLKKMSIDKNIEVLKSIGTKPEKLAETRAKLESENLFSIGNAIQTLIITYIIPLSIIGLLLAAAFKKNPPRN